MSSDPMSSDALQQFLDSQMRSSEELLETGIYTGSHQLVSSAYDSLKKLQPLIPADALNHHKGKMLRALSMLARLDPGRGMAHMQEAEKFAPNDPIVLGNLGFLSHNVQGDFDKAIQYYLECIALDPKYVNAYIGLISIYGSLRKHNLELDLSKKALEECPEVAELWNLHGMAMMRSGTNSHPVLKKCFEKAIHLKPEPRDLAVSHINIGRLAVEAGNVQAAMDSFLKALAIHPVNRWAARCILSHLQFCEEMDPVCAFFGVAKPKGITRSELITTLHEAVTLRMYGRLPPSDVNRDAIEKILESKRKSKMRHRLAASSLTFPSPLYKPIHPLRVKLTVIAYIGGDFCDSSTTALRKDLFDHMDRALFKVIVYGNVPYDVARLNHFQIDQYRCIYDRSAEMAAKTMLEDGVDILVDLSGHSDAGRVDVLSLRPAPVILSFQETGLPFVTRITDSYSEKFTRMRSDRLILSRPPFTFAPHEDAVNHIKSFQGFKSKQNGGQNVTFGCFAPLHYVNTQLVSTWSDILKRVPNARLLLKSHLFRDDAVRRTWKGKFDEGLQRSIILLSGSKEHEERMASYRLVDIYLDTFPASDPVRTVESLHLNVPVITLAPSEKGSHYWQRTSGSILTALGLQDECVATSAGEYILKAVSMVEMLPHLGVRNRLLSSPLMKPKAFMSEYETALYSLDIRGNLKL